MPDFRVASMFCGCGGMDVGFEGGFDYLGRRYERLPFKVVWANDFNPRSAKMYDGCFGLGKCTVGDVKKIETKDIPDFDVLTGGFPCQPFSMMGNRDGLLDARGTLFAEICRFLKEKKPKATVMENVAGLLSANDGEAYPMVMSSFKACGYYVKCALLKAERFRVPQTRHRVFFVGFRDFMDYVRFSYPAGSPEEVGVGAALEKGPVPDKLWVAEDVVAEAEAKGFPFLNLGENLSKPIGTVMCKYCEATNLWGSTAVRVGGRMRRCTMRELARIQSFPDSYPVDYEPNQAQYGIGNAVPPVLAWHIASCLKGALGG